MKSKAILMIPIALAWSCELVVDVKVPAEKPKLVINSLFNPDSTWNVSVSTSRYILDGSPFVPVTDAQVRILDENNNEVSTLEYRDSVFAPIFQWGTYSSSGKPEEGMKYSIEVSANGMETVFASSMVPKPVLISNVKFDSAVITGSGSPYTSNIPMEITFSDPADEVNYYEVRVFAEAVYTRYLQPQQTVQDTAWFTVEVRIKDLSVEQEEGLLANKFSDVRFNGKVHTVPTEIFLRRLYLDVLRVRVVLMHVSEEHFRYTTTAARQNDSEYYEPFAQPVQVFNNIQNGFGVFAGHSRSFVEFRKNE